MSQSFTVVLCAICFIGCSSNSLTRLSENEVITTCDDLFIALTRYFHAASLHPHINMRMMREAEKRNWGVDIFNKKDLKRFSCQLVDAETIDDLARIRGKSLQDTLHFYRNTFVTGRRILEDQEHYLANAPDQITRELVKLSLNVMRTFYDLGLYDLDNEGTAGS